MDIDILTRQAVEKCLQRNLPFVLFLLPGESMARFYASVDDSDGCSPAFVDGNEDCFFINFFDNDEPYTAGVPFRYTASEILEKINGRLKVQTSAQIRPQVASTHRASYHDAFPKIVRRLKYFGGKVVLSRHRTLFTTRSPLDIAEDYFKLTDTTFRYLCFTPETGLWLGSTPELLIESDSTKSEIRTMALAGTRLSDDPSPWDDKNTTEQSYVTEFIENTLREHDLNVSVGELSERSFLKLKHLCTEIKAKGDVDVRELMSALSPTPAVAGFPRESALEDISVYETHRRYCYGGYVGVRIEGDYHAYVNLRCCFMAPVMFESKTDGWLCNLYAGGGILEESIEADEWNETEAKMEALANILNGSDGNSGVEGRKVNVRNVFFLEEPFIS